MVKYKDYYCYDDYYSCAKRESESVCGIAAQVLCTTKCRELVQVLDDIDDDDAKFECYDDEVPVLIGCCVCACCDACACCCIVREALEMA
jgi:hypothetical protein